MRGGVHFGHDGGRVFVEMVDLNGFGVDFPDARGKFISSKHRRKLK